MDVCVLCGTADRDKEYDHVREVYYIRSQDRFDPSMFKPITMMEDDRRRLQGGFNSICSNRRLCEKRQRDKILK